jgi:site-specific recombinase XerD
MIHTLSRALTFYFRDYLGRARGVSPNTIKSYRQTFELLTDFLKEKTDLGAAGQIRITQITPDLVLDFLDYLEDPLRGRGNGTSTRNHRLSALRSFYKCLPLLHSRYIPLTGRMDAVPLKRTISRPPDFLERDELRAVFAAVERGSKKGTRDLALLLFMYNIGARASEAAEARLSWVRFGGELPHVRVWGKGRRERLCPLWNVTAAFLKHYLATARPAVAREHDDCLFLNMRSKPFSRQGIWRIVRLYIGRAANQCPSLLEKHLTPHSIRHSLGVHLRQSGVDLSVIRSWLGHVRLDTTIKYARVRIQDAKSSVDKFFSLAEVFPYTAEDKEVKETIDESTLQWLESL